MAELFDTGIFSVEDTDGSVGAGWKLNFYVTGTSTRQNTYPTEADAEAGTNANANPVVAEADGRFPQIWLKTTGSAYKATLADESDVVKETRDPAMYSLARSLASTASGKGGALVAGVPQVVRVTDHGVSTAASAATNLANFKTAVAACSAGDTLYVPIGTYAIDTSGGLTAAIAVATSITIDLRGTLQASTQAIQANPPTILNITADNVTITGDGKLLGPGTVNSVNTGTEDTLPSLLRVTGANFTMRGITVDNPYKVGVHLYSCTNALIEGCKFTGGPTAYSDTAHFGIRINNVGGRHTIKGNRFYPNGSGGMFVQCIFSNGAGDNLIEGNFAYRPYEKLAYLTGDRNVIVGNVVIGNSGTIAGTNQTGTVGTVYRCDGANNKISGNYSIYGGGATCRIGGGNDISNNTFLNAGQGGIGISGPTAVIDNTTIRGNTITCGNLTGVVVTHGISITTGTGTNRRVDVSDNIVSGFGITDPIANVPTWQAATAYATVSTVKPTVGNSRYYTTTGGGTSGGSEPTWPTTAGNTVVDGTITWTCVAYDTTNAAISLDGTSGAFEACTVSNNNTTGGYYGLKSTSLTGSKIDNNLFGATNTGVIESGGGTNQYRNNTVSGAGTEKSGLAATCTWVNYIASTFAPVLSDGTNNATMGNSSSNLCAYTRHGDVVTVTGGVASSSLGSVTGAVRITGLPYAARSGVGGNSAISIGYSGGLAISANQVVTGIVQPGNTYIDLYLWDATTGTTALQATEWSDDGNIVFSLTYHAA